LVQVSYASRPDFSFFFFFPIIFRFALNDYSTDKNSNKIKIKNSLGKIFCGKTGKKSTY
jgi:hypothetical protein